MKQSNYYSNWQNNRVKFILDLYPFDFFKDKKVLELGSHNGYIGNYFLEKLKSKVTSVEGRFENFCKIKENYPLLNVQCCDLDTDKWDFGKYDVIINFGLYYHLEKHHEKHLVNCINNCDLMFFETVIYDSFDSEIFFRNESGNDQSLTDRGGTPSTSYVEDIFEKTNCKFKKYCDFELNGEGHHYDWKDANTKTFDDRSRRFWVIK